MNTNDEVNNMQEFRFILLDKKLIDKFVWEIHKPEPSGYGTVPPDSMRTVWGVEEIHSGIIITQGYEDPSREWQGKEGDHHISYDISSPDGIFYADFDTNAYGDYVEYIRFPYSDKNHLQIKYKEIVINAIRYYQSDGFKNGDWDIFQKEFERKFGESIFDYERKKSKEYYNEWKNKWGL